MPTLVHGDGCDGGNQRFGKVAQRLVAGEQRHGDAVISGGVGIDSEGDREGCIISREQRLHIRELIGKQGKIMRGVREAR